MHVNTHDISGPQDFNNMLPRISISTENPPIEAILDYCQLWTLHDFFWILLYSCWQYSWTKFKSYKINLVLHKHWPNKKIVNFLPAWRCSIVVKETNFLEHPNDAKCWIMDHAYIEQQFLVGRRGKLSTISHWVGIV